MADARVIPIRGGRRAGRPEAHRTGGTGAAPATVTRVDRGPLGPAPSDPIPSADGLDPSEAGPELAGDAGPNAAQANESQTPETRADETRAEHLGNALAFLRRRITGDYDVDEFGFDPDLTASALLPLARQLQQHWFRTEILGAEHLPLDTGGLIVANHAGALWALDSVMTATAVHDGTGGERFLRMLGADLIFATPGLATLARRAGTTLACAEDTHRLLAAGELVGVWPEGFKGIGKPFRERYNVQRFGRGQFVAAALRTSTPIIATSVVGSEEIHPMLADLKPLAKLLRLPYFPLTPTFPHLGLLGLIPLPSKWLIEFGEPIETAHYGPEGADDARLVFELTDRVRTEVQRTLTRLRARRVSVWR